MKSVTEIYDYLSSYSNLAMAAALYHLAAGTRLTYALQYGTASLWLREAGKYAAMSFYLAIAKERVASHLPDAAASK